MERRGTTRYFLERILTKKTIFGGRFIQNWFHSGRKRPPKTNKTNDMIKHFIDIKSWFKITESISSDYWSIQGNKLVGKFSFNSEKELNDFLEEVKKISNKLKHDPVVKKQGKKKCQLDIWTHSVNAITKKDFELANKISGLV